jgi:hypothetical protein
MGEHAAQRITDQPGGGRKGSSTPTPQALGRQLLDILVYANRCRIGDKLTLDDLVETSKIGDWKMPDFKAACAYAASQGWLIVQGGVLTLTTAGLAAA